MTKLDDVLELHFKATWEKRWPRDVRAKWTTFEKIAFSIDWGYERYVNRAQKKITEKRLQNKDVNDDMNKIGKIYRDAYELMKSRNQKYWDSRKVMSVQAIASLCEMKLNRIAQLWELEAKTKDEAEDVLNYMVFILYNLQQQHD